MPNFVIDDSSCGGNAQITVCQSVGGWYDRGTWYDCEVCMNKSKPSSPSKTEQTLEDILYDFTSNWCKCEQRYETIHSLAKKFCMGLSSKVTHQDPSKVINGKSVAVYWVNEMDKRLPREDMDKHDQELYDALKQSLQKDQR